MVRQPDGTLGEVNFDTVTGQQTQAPVSGPQIQSNDAFVSDLKELGLSPTGEQTIAPKKTTAQQVNEAPSQELKHNGGDRAVEAGLKDAKAGSFGARQQGNNFGYIDKPGILGYAGMLPGAMGLAGKAVNMGINANNMAAVEKARESIGLEPKGFGSKLGGILKDNKGVVAEAKIDNNQYSVGLEALDPTGRTTLTPDEAGRRAGIKGTRVVEATPAETAAAKKSFTNEYGSWFDRAKQEVGSIFSSIFGDTIDSGGKLSDRSNEFPDKPDAPQGGDKSWGDMSESDRDHARGISGEVSDAIDRGQAGLY